VNIVIGSASEKLRKGVLLGKYHVFDVYFGRFLIPGTECDTNVAIGDHADDIATLTDYREEPAAVFAHQFDCSGQVGIKAAEHRPPSHYVSNLHTQSSFSNRWKGSIVLQTQLKRDSRATHLPLPPFLTFGRSRPVLDWGSNGSLFSRQNQANGLII
jgi:hypothetical protein